MFFRIKIREFFLALRERFSKFPPFSRWLRIFEVLNKKEKIIFLTLFILFWGSLFVLGVKFYYKNTVLRPAEGGSYTEGLVGFPRFLNPVLATSDVDRDIIEIIFSGLMKYDAEGKIVKDLTKNLEIKEKGKIYDVYLKENLFWHDGKKITPDDIIYTVRIIQDPEYKSPQRANWLGVEVEKIEDEKGRGVRFKLSKSYAGFKERLTLKIIPKHIWQEISPQNFSLSLYNLNPIGSGPYRFQNLNQDKEGQISSLELIRFKKYHGEKPYLSQISFRFFETETQAVQSFYRGEIDGLSPSLKLMVEGAPKQIGINEYSFLWPRYFALFFNPKKVKDLNRKKVRQALNYATNKQEIIDQVFEERAKIVDSPILPEIFGFKHPSEIYQFDPEKAQDFLLASGFKKENGQFVKVVGQQFPEFKSDLEVGSRGKEVENLQACLAQFSDIYPEGKITGYFGSQTKRAVIRFQEKYASDILAPWGFKTGTGMVGKTTRKKLNEICGKPPEVIPLRFVLSTAQSPILEEIADFLKRQWESLGIGLEIETFSISELEQTIIKPRNYQILLFGQALQAIPDPFPFWHSSQIRDPGLNLTGFDSKAADSLLEGARMSLDHQIRSGKYEDFQEILIEEAPVVFLCNPNYVYWISSKIKGIREGGLIVDPSKRFSGIENWYIKTRRVLK